VTARTRADRARASRPGAAELMRVANAARRQSYAPYSRFTVGAALLTRGGRVIAASNVENSSYGLSICAERAAVFKAISEGERDFVAIAVTGPAGRAAQPCGSCRQVLHEFAPGLIVHFRGAGGRTLTRSLDQLLPHAFDFDHKTGGRS
jgi:cytidine deaminase